MNLIKEIGESRRDWMLAQFEEAGNIDQRISKYKFWQETNHAILLDSNRLIDQRINYTHENPVRVLIVKNSFDYLFSSAIDYSGAQGFVEVIVVK